MRTPWGTAQSVEHIAPGIQFVSTASHGGFKLSAQRNRQVPSYMRRKGGWYEEDVEWSIVVSVFPDDFPEKDRAGAEKTFRDWFPDQYEKFTDKTILPGASHVKDERRFIEEHKNDYIGLAAWGDWHPRVPEGFVVVFAGRGGRTASGAYPKDTGYFLVPEGEYEGRRRFFVIDPDLHKRVKPIN